MQLDQAISNFFVSVQSPLTNTFFSWVSLSVCIAIVLALAWLVYKKYETKFLCFAIGTGLLYLLIELIKRIILRPRPDLLDNFSFPSRHAALAFFIAFFMPVEKKWKIVLYLWAILVGTSRLWLNAHWFTDVLIGALIGILAAYLFKQEFIEKTLAKLSLAGPRKS
jgi:undecaprenyl-diphosphatase